MTKSRNLRVNIYEIVCQCVFVFVFVCVQRETRQRLAMGPSAPNAGYKESAWGGITHTPGAVGNGHSDKLVEEHLERLTLLVIPCT